MHGCASFIATGTGDGAQKDPEKRVYFWYTLQQQIVLRFRFSGEIHKFYASSFDHHV
jgi:hypothetical protein